MQEPFDSTNPGRHVAHCSWLIVDATLKLGIPQEVHLAGQPVCRLDLTSDNNDRYLLSQECLLLFAIMLEPVQTPLLLVGTQLPPSKN